jgi:hypothetical protein
MTPADPLTDFTHWHKQAPYTHPAGWDGRTTRVVPVRSKTGLVASRLGGIAHLDNGVAVIFLGGTKVRFGARYLCAGGSNDVAILPNAVPYGGICELCVDAAAGPCVYRCLDAAAALLYIGSAEKAQARFTGHRTRSSWWPEVADIKITRYPTIFEARAAERIAILAEDPIHNRMPKNRKRRSA